MVSWGDDAADAFGGGGREGSTGGWGGGHGKGLGGEVEEGTPSVSQRCGGVCHCGEVFQGQTFGPRKPMGLVLDSSVLIGSERKRFSLGDFLESEAPMEPIFLTVLTASELFHGVERAQEAATRSRRRAFVEEVIRGTPILDFDLACARVHASLWSQLEQKGERIGAHDMLIAAVCLRFGYRLATLNEREFRRVKGLKLASTQPFVLTS